jgi:hypothetical protein
MGQKCRKYSKARKNGLISNPKKEQSISEKNKNAFKEKCRKV